MLMSDKMVHGICVLSVLVLMSDKMIHGICVLSVLVLMSDKLIEALVIYLSYACQKYNKLIIT